MSNTHSSQRNSRCQQRNATIREFVAERDGHGWCLFLDRDGVVNRQIIGDYVRRWRDFEWLPGAKSALKELSDWAPHLVVVTNQQGVGKGLMSADDVAEIHHRLQAELAIEGVFIDAFQVCPHLESAGCLCRKPRPGLVLDWLAAHQDNSSALSIVVGDSESDLELAHNVAPASGGCASVQIGGRVFQGGVADASFDSLWDFAVAVSRAREARVRDLEALGIDRETRSDSRCN